MRTKNLERNAEIIARRMGGEPCWRIARDMGISRNIVIGVSHRANIILDDNSAAMNAKYAEKPAANAVLNPALVRMIRLTYKRGKHGSGTTSIAKALGVAQKTVSLVCQGKTWKHVQ